ncbi:hypothetical protein DL767_000026 [Monosporascus sp. MG133]|nr:hypothetical protein DL767_000026 [Monosporascus sp. MG133]
MPRPDPPDDCEEASDYKAGDAVYYFRSGKWRAGIIKGKGGSSDESPRYSVTDDAKGDERLVGEGDIRKKN